MMLLKFRARDDKVLRSFLNKELNAEIRNKLQPVKTALELTKEGKKLPKEFLDTALKSLREAEEMINER